MDGGQYVLLEAAAPQFQEKAFGEYHLYTLPRPTTIKDNEVKQIELLAAEGVPVAEKKYLFDPMRDFHPYWQGPMQDPGRISPSPRRGRCWCSSRSKTTRSRTWACRCRRARCGCSSATARSWSLSARIRSSIRPRTRRSSSDGQRLRYRRRAQAATNFVTGPGANWMEESLRDHASQPQEGAGDRDAREHLFRWTNWRITSKSQDFTKLDAQTIEFPVTLAPDEEKKVTYTVRYEW